MYYSETKFEYPTLTRNGKQTHDGKNIGFENCDFRNVSEINLSGFYKAKFEGLRNAFNPNKKTTININDCGIVRFESIFFEKAKITLTIKNVPHITFYGLANMQNMQLSIQNCDSFSVENTCCTGVDTSHIECKKLYISGQIDTRILDLSGVSEKLSICSADVFDVKEFIVRPNIDLYLSDTYGTNGAKQALGSVLRYQKRSK